MILIKIKNYTCPILVIKIKKTVFCNSKERFFLYIFCHRFRYSCFFDRSKDFSVCLSIVFAKTKVLSPTTATLP